MYDLLSVIVHVGEIETGHYVSYCRVGDQVRSSFSICKSTRKRLKLMSLLCTVVQIQ